MPGIDRLLRPRTIAVIGGGTWCANVIEQCRLIGFTGDIWAVHPTRDTVAGVAAYPNIDTLPDAPDAAFIGVNRDLTIEAVRSLARRGAGGAVCFASGFREAQAETGDGCEKQDALLEAANGMTILGPNCYGFLNYLDGAALWPDQHGGVRVPRGVALVTQSSNIAINLTMQQRGLPVAYVVTAGNQAQTGLTEIARALLRDDRVSAIGLHIEGIDDLRAFEAFAHEAHLAGKPVVALKVGASDQAQAATISHTASLAGSYAGARALFARLGIAQVRSLPAMLETLKLLHVAGPLTSNRIGSMSCSGGEASLMADTAHGTALEFPPLDQSQKNALRTALGPKVALANPLDYHTYIWGDDDAMTACFTGMMQGDLAIGCVVLDFPRADRCDPAAWTPVIDVVARTKAATGKPMAVVASLGETMPEDIASTFIEMGIVPFCGMQEAVDALQASMQIVHGHHAPLLVPNAEPASLSQTLTEAQAKAELHTHGVRIPKAARASNPDDAAKAALQIGFPVVLKGEGIAHKTEAGAVRINLSNSEAVFEAARAMPTMQFLVEEMVTGTVAEILIGVVADPAHGYVLTLAAGGTLTEIMHDSASLLVPTSRDAVKHAVAGLRVAALMNGYRGQPAADIDAIVDTVMAVQDYVAAALPQEIEINPLMCGPNGAIVADALIRIGDET